MVEMLHNTGSAIGNQAIATVHRKVSGLIDFFKDVRMGFFMSAGNGNWFFAGHVAPTVDGSRLAVATDNSVYQKLPQAVIFPKGVTDLQALGELANQHPDVRFSARGGGTGTNGQSLTDGIVVDMSRLSA